MGIFTRLDKIIANFFILKNTIKSIFIILLITCLITNQSIPNAIKEIFNKKTSTKSYKLELIKDFITQEKTENGNIGFLVPNNNYIHWKLNESRHGFPQKAVFRNIAEGKMDIISKNEKSLNYNFLLPTSNQLCETLKTNAPEYLITEKNDYTYICLDEKSSKYKLLTSTQELNQNNIYIFKKIKNK